MKPRVMALAATAAYLIAAGAHGAPIWPNVAFVVDDVDSLSGEKVFLLEGDSRLGLTKQHTAKNEESRSLFGATNSRRPVAGGMDFARSEPGALMPYGDGPLSSGMAAFAAARHEAAANRARRSGGALDADNAALGTPGAPQGAFREDYADSDDVTAIDVVEAPSANDDLAPLADGRDGGSIDADPAGSGPVDIDGADGDPVDLDTVPGDETRDDGVTTDQPTGSPDEDPDSVDERIDTDDNFDLVNMDFGQDLYPGIPTTLPEPATLTLLCVGLLGLAARQRRRRHPLS